MSPELCQLLAYWNGLGGTEAPPERARLELRQLTALLPWMFILEMSTDGSLRYRLAGSGLEEAVGCGMAGKTYADIFHDHEQASVMEELYAVSLVQGSGLVRTGAFSLNSDENRALEVLVLPFLDTRAMGGTVLVGVVRPFNVLNEGFMDHWGSFKHELTTLMVIPSPRIITTGHLSERVKAMLGAMGVELRILDVSRLVDLISQGVSDLDAADIPSFAMDGLSGKQERLLN